MTPRTEAQFEQLRAESRDRIERAALRVFAARGVEAATVREIAREAGVSQGLLYNYYPGKHELLAAIFRRGMADVDASLGAAGQEGAREERLRRTVVAAMTLVREHLDYWRIAYQLRWQQSLPTLLQEEVRGWNARILSGLEAQLVDASASGVGEADAEAQARLLFATIDGVAQHYALDPEGYPIDAVVEALVASAVRRPPPPNAAGDAAP